MTPADPAQGEPAPPPGTMALNRFQTVGTAAGNEATTGAEQWREPTAVETDQADHQLSHGLAETLSNDFQEADR